VPVASKQLCPCQHSSNVRAASPNWSRLASLNWSRLFGPALSQVDHDEGAEASSEASLATARLTASGADDASGEQPSASEQRLQTVASSHRHRPCADSALLGDHQQTPWAPAMVVDGVVTADAQHGDQQGRHFLRTQAVMQVLAAAMEEAGAPTPQAMVWSTFEILKAQRNQAGMCFRVVESESPAAAAPAPPPSLPLAA